MSMPVNNARTFAYISIPIILLALLTGLVIWQTMEKTPLSIGKGLQLHTAIDLITGDTGEPKPLATKSLNETIGKDPFLRYQQVEIKKIVKEPTILEEITLSTIAEGAQGRYCLINGTIYVEEQQSRYFRIKEIQAEAVVFEIGGKAFSLGVGRKGVIENGQLVPYTPKVSD